MRPPRGASCIILYVHGPWPFGPLYIHRTNGPFPPGIDLTVTSRRGRVKGDDQLRLFCTSRVLRVTRVLTLKWLWFVWRQLVGESASHETKSQKWVLRSNPMQSGCDFLYGAGGGSRNVNDPCDNCMCLAEGPSGTLRSEATFEYILST